MFLLKCITLMIPLALHKLCSNRNKVGVSPPLLIKPPGDKINIVSVSSKMSRMVKLISLISLKPMKMSPKG